jgi:hypothetical protein
MPENTNPIVLSDIHLLLCLPHCIIGHSFYSSVYPIVLSDIHFTALFTPLYSSKMNVRQYNVENRAVK